MRKGKSIGANSWIECDFAYKKANIAKQILSALDIAIPKYGEVFILIRVGDYKDISKTEQKNIGIPVETGAKGVRQGSIQLILKDEIIKREDLKLC